jgi:hypothetical protein
MTEPSSVPGFSLILAHSPPPWDNHQDLYPPILPRGETSLPLSDDQAISPEDRPAWATLRLWNQRARLLRELSGCAFRNGKALEAADFEEAADRVESWVGSLFKLLLKRIRQVGTAD